MGQKVNAIGFRIGVNHTWSSRWYVAKKNYSNLLFKDMEIKKFIFDKLGYAVVSNVVIERPGQKVCVTVFSSKPGVIIGKKGAGIDAFKKELDKVSGMECVFNIMEIIRPDLDAVGVANSIARQLEKRVSFRRAMKKSMQSSIRAGAKGFRAVCAGRLGGTEIARSEKVSSGAIPLHTLRSDINFALALARTAYGIIGVKVWINLGEISCYDPETYDKRLSRS